MYTGPCYFFFNMTTGHSHLLASMVVKNEEDMFVIWWAKTLFTEGTKKPRDFRWNNLVTWIIYILYVNGESLNNPARWFSLGLSKINISAIDAEETRHSQRCCLCLIFLGSLLNQLTAGQHNCTQSLGRGGVERDAQREGGKDRDRKEKEKESPKARNPHTSPAVT